MKIHHRILILICVLALFGACRPREEGRLRLATTTSTYDSGLLDAIIPDFEAIFGVSVDILAVGTGQAIALGERGDVDVILVHARAREDAFVSSGFGVERFDVMYNDFILVGPLNDPAGIAHTPLAVDALARIASAEASFASRGDDSGTHTRELELWGAAGGQPVHDAPWYNALGQSMGAVLQFANERGAYTLTDRGTYLALKHSLPRLMIMVGGESIAENMDPDLINPYGVIAVNGDHHPGTAVHLAVDFIQWITSAEVQASIAEFGIREYGQPLFYPDAQAWRE